LPGWANQFDADDLSIGIKISDQQFGSERRMKQLITMIGFPVDESNVADIG